jgi:hypothetical protein
VDFAALPELDKRMLQMFNITSGKRQRMIGTAMMVLENLYSLADSPVMLAELMELLRYKYDHIDLLMSQSIWVLIARLTCTALTPVISCWWRWITFRPPMSVREQNGAGKEARCTFHNVK